jgi:hypothetical protein
MAQKPHPCHSQANFRGFGYVKMTIPRSWLVLAMAATLVFEPSYAQGTSIPGDGQTEEEQSASAAETAEASGSERPEDQRLATGTRSVGKWLAGRGVNDPRPIETLLGNGLLSPSYFDWKQRLWMERDIAFGGYVSANVQWGSEDSPSHSISETLFLLTWEPVRDADSAGRLIVGLAHDRTFGHPTTREFANFQGLVETPNDLDTDPELTFTTLGLLHWEHEQWTGKDKGWGIRAGQIYAPSYFGSARYLDDDRRFFMARPLATPAGAQWVGNNDIGLGINGIFWKGAWYASAAVIDGKANRKYPDFSSLVDGEFLYIGEVGYERDFDGPNEAAVRLTVSHLDLKAGENPELGSGQSIMVSANRRFNNRWALAARWSKSYNRLSADYRELYSLAFMWLSPLERIRDIAGFGLFSGDPSEADKGRESGFEMFYGFKLTQALGVMGNIQYWSRDDPDEIETSSWVFGLRMEFAY